MPHIAQDDGTTLTIELSAGAFAFIDRADFNNLPDFVRCGRWFLNRRRRSGHAYVYCNRGTRRKGIQPRPACAAISRRRNFNTHSQCAPVARFVVGASPRKQVRYRNGDRLDLRRANLYQA